MRALKGVDWEINSGEAVALMGPSGCGKTTLLNLLGGVDHATGGDIVVGDQKLGSLTERDLERYRLHRVGFVFQFFNLIPTLTAVENLELPMLIAGVDAVERRQRVEGLLQMVGLGAKGHKRPEELSGGEQQRVAVALSLANDPALILADEPTGNLDTENTKAIYSAFLVAGGAIRQDGDHGESRSESRRAVQESLQYAGWKFCVGFGDRWMLT